MTPGDRSQLVFLAGDAPDGLYCADETKPVAGLVCSQLGEGLYAYEPGSAAVAPALAQACEPNPELTTWRARFAQVSRSTMAARSTPTTWSCRSSRSGMPTTRCIAVGRGTFQPFIDVFGGLLNPPPTAQVP